jgi:hypothetical protein
MNLEWAVPGGSMVRRQTAAGEARLLFAESGEGRLHRALELLLDDELGLAVAKQHD